MSWMPSTDPILGDKRSSDALEFVVIPRVRDLGDGFEVRRALRSDKRQMVGPFIFFDQMGPAQFLAGHGLDVRPHPHIGLATVTYLFDGRVMHRDSEGNALEITPGAMNLMTAGRGIAHSELTPANARRGGDGLFEIQSWIDREPNLITCGRAIYSLQHKIKTEGQLQFADHDDRRLFSPQGDQIAAADFALDREPECFR